MISPVRQKTIVFAGGGTGGHLFPAVALARELPLAWRPLFLVPDNRGDVERLNGEFAVETMRCPRPDRGKIVFPARLAAAVRRARRFLVRERAVGVVGLGGYPSLPAAIAARTLRLPLYLMEVNAVPGKATRWLASGAAGVGLGHALARTALSPRARCRVTGTPLRAELRREAGLAEFGLDAGRPTLLVLGGSQGATGLNERILNALESCRDLDFQVLHCSGARDLDRMRAAYLQHDVRAEVISFLPDIGRAYAVADLVLSRAGASTVAECAAMERPAVFVPYPWHRDRQQARNAQALVDAGAARLVEEQDLDPKTLRSIIAEVLLDETQRHSMAQNARRVATPGAAREMAMHLLESFAPALQHADAGPGIVELGE